MHVCTLREKQGANTVEGINPIEGRHSVSVRNLKESLEAKANQWGGKNVQCPKHWLATGTEFRSQNLCKCGVDVLWQPPWNSRTCK